VAGGHASVIIVLEALRKTKIHCGVVYVHGDCGD
jgi:hypothetical protein